MLSVHSHAPPLPSLQLSQQWGHDSSREPAPAGVSSPTLPAPALPRIPFEQVQMPASRWTFQSRLFTCQNAISQPNKPHLMWFGHVPPPLHPCWQARSGRGLASARRGRGRSTRWGESSPRAACSFLTSILEAANAAVMSLGYPGFQRSLRIPDGGPLARRFPEQGAAG